MRSTKKPASPQKIRSTSELAKVLNLSRWTVSRVLNGHPGVHPDTVARVQAAIQEYGFTPNPHAQGLRRGRLDRVGVCVPDADLLFLGRKLELLHQTLDAAGVPLLVGLTDGSREEEIETLNHFRASRVAAVALFASQLPDDHPAITQLGSIPLVSIDPVAPLSRCRSGGILSVQIDRATGMREAMAHLYDLGHRHFATLGIDGEGSYTQIRLQAVVDFLVSKQLSPETHLHRYPLPDPDNLYEAGRLSAERYFPSPATAILALNDRVAIGLLDGLRQRGMHVPGDYSIVGYDNMEVAEYLYPALTTIDAKPRQLIEQAVALLLAAMRSETESATTQALPSSLVVRASTGCARRK